MKGRTRVKTGTAEIGGLRTSSHAGTITDMEDVIALNLAVDTAASFLRGEITPLETARKMTGIVNPWRFWWDDMGGADGPLSTFYAADEVGMNLPWIGKDVELWHQDVREKKRSELHAAELRWEQPIRTACEAVIQYVAAGDGR
jgi:hypothetical protein